MYESVMSQYSLTTAELSEESGTIYRVIEVYPGPDGRVRNVKVKTAESEYLRPVTKIAVICPAEGDDC